ncbi:APC family permease [Oliverpabstia intestinalis]|uniref:APC family permease n=1 Tax=Oliverpabstia intestinalis TaxID=2606633 RepID=UPI003F891A0A
MMNGHRELNKVLNTKDVLVIAFGAMIGWGWVVSSGQWIQTGGVLGTAIAFAIGGIMIFFVGLTYAELTTAMPKCGGEHVFSFRAFGPVGSFICTWAIILSYIGVVCYESVSFPTIIQYLFPGYMKGYMYTVAGFDVYASWVAVGVALAVIIMVINMIGTKKAAMLQTVLTLVIAGVGIVLAAGSVFSGSPENMGTQLFNSESSSLVGSIARVAVMTPFFFFGFDVIPQAAEEIKVPLKKLGKLMILSIVMAVAFYTMVVLSVGYVLNANEINTSMSTTGLVTADAMAKAFSSQMMAKVLIIGGLCGIVTSWNSFLIGGSRAIYAMSTSYMLPATFGKLHKKRKTPIFAIALVGGLSIIAPFFGRVMLVWIVDAANFACCLAYCMVSLSFVVLRKKLPDMKRPYEVKHYKLIGFLAVALSGAMALMYVIPKTGCTLNVYEWIIVGGWAAIGVFCYIWSKVKYKEKFASEVFHEV